MARHLFPNSVKDPLKRIHVQEVRDLDTQKRVLSYSLPAFMAQKKIRLVIVDSIGCNYRCEEQSGALRGRSMYDMGRSLKKLASDFNAVILVTNQVTDAFQEAPRQISISENRCESVTIDGEFLPGGKKPALGLMWSNFITTRIFLTKQQSTQECGVEGEDSSRGGPNRSLFIIFSSSVPCRDFPIAITNSGIQSLQ